MYPVSDPAHTIKLCRRGSFAVFLLDSIFVYFYFLYPLHMAPLAKARGLLTGVLSIFGNKEKNNGNTGSTLLGSSLSRLGTVSAPVLGDYLTDNVRTSMTYTYLGLA